MELMEFMELMTITITHSLGTKEEQTIKNFKFSPLFNFQVAQKTAK